LELSGYVYDEDTIEYDGDITYASPQTNSEKPTGGTTIKDTYRGVVSEEKPKGGKIITKS